MGSLSVALIDDHRLFREGLKVLLAQHDVDVVASSGEGLRGVELVQKIQPDVVLVAVRMPTVDGIQVLEALSKRGFAKPVVMLTASKKTDDLADSIKHGAKGYLLKDIAPDDLVTALRAAIRGETVIAPSLRATFEKLDMGEPPSPCLDDLVSRLTPRERQVLELLVQGQSNKLIADTLGITFGTVKLHVNMILKKLGVHSRTEAAMIEVRRTIRKGH